jgi:saccharopine dehydrogenase-like NADP-dependent oxidoreductase
VLSRASSATKPAVVALKEKGVEIRTADVAADDIATLKTALRGVDVLISVVSAFALDSQRPAFEAAKEAGVKRCVWNVDDVLPWFIETGRVR